MQDVSSGSSDITTLTLTPDNPTNTSISNSDGHVLYSVTTEYTRKATFTQVRDEDEEVIGSLEWKDVLADRVRIGDSKPMSLWDWMKKSPVPFKDQTVFTDDQGRKYKWKGLAPGLSLQLFAEDDNYTAVIAKFQRSHAAYPPPAPRLSSPSAVSTLSLSPTLTDDLDAASISPTLANSDTQSIAPTLINELGTTSPYTQGSRKARTPAVLLLTPRAVEIQNLVVLSFLFLEKYHRTKESSSTAITNGYMYPRAC